jgi:putative transposase
MPNYRRVYVPGGTLFFTLVTNQRQPLFQEARWRQVLREAIKIQDDRPFTIEAIVLLPDHLHCIWTLPPEDVDYSTRWGRIKEEFTRRYLDLGGREASVSDSRTKHAERGVWQRRFWEHACRDQDDLNRCFDYIHWNPVKHGLVQLPREYPHSSFHRFVAAGAYPLDWGSGDPVPGYDDPEWGDPGLR